MEEQIYFYSTKAKTTAIQSLIMFSYPAFSILHGHGKAYPGMFFGKYLFSFFEVDLGGHDGAVA
ncbi:MAG: hypothetical protein ABJC12_12170, partial [Saprospiraceae bacterium]